jgi:protein SCO1/2
MKALRKKPIVWLWAGLFLMVAFVVVAIVNPACLGIAPRRDAQGTVLPPGGDFTLDTVRGPFRLSDYRGQVVWIYFGYTFCPDICPTALTTVADTLKLLRPEERKRVQPVFISVDPARDTPQQMETYVSFFHPAIIGATGTTAQIQAVARQYGAVYRIQPPEPGNTHYAVDHSATSLLVAPDGHLATVLPHESTPVSSAAAIRALLPSP